MGHGRSTSQGQHPLVTLTQTDPDNGTRNFINTKIFPEMGKLDALISMDSHFRKEDNILLSLKCAHSRESLTHDEIRGCQVRS